MKDGTRKTEEFRAGIYTVSVYPSESERAPVVYLPDIAEGGEELISSCSGKRKVCEEVRHGAYHRLGQGTLALAGALSGNNGGSGKGYGKSTFYHADL